MFNWAKKNNKKDVLDLTPNGKEEDINIPKSVRERLEKKQQQASSPAQTKQPSGGSGFFNGFFNNPASSETTSQTQITSSSSYSSSSSMNKQQLSDRLRDIIRGINKLSDRVELLEKKVDRLEGK